MLSTMSASLWKFLELPFFRLSVWEYPIRYSDFFSCGPWCIKGMIQLMTLKVMHLKILLGWMSEVRKGGQHVKIGEISSWWNYSYMMICTDLIQVLPFNPVGRGGGGCIGL